MAEEIRPQPAEEELNDQLQVRRDKLTALREAGQDPFTVTRWQRSHDAQ